MLYHLQKHTKCYAHLLHIPFCSSVFDFKQTRKKSFFLCWMGRFISFSCTLHRKRRLRLLTMSTSGHCYEPHRWMNHIYILIMEIVIWFLIINIRLISLLCIIIMRRYVYRWNFIVQCIGWFVTIYKRIQCKRVKCFFFSFDHFLIEEKKQAEQN